VCVADDCEDEVTVLCEGLKINGYGAVGAYTGQEALDLCESGDVDLLLLDIGLPDIDGYAVCEQLKGNPNTKDIPVIFVTAKGEAKHVSEGYRLGAVDYIPKPYNLPIVMVRVESALRTRAVTGDIGSHHDSMRDLAYTDQLTGLRNRRFLLERLQEEVEKAHRYDHSVSCMVVDVDDIKAMEIEWGTASMDDLLVEIAMAMRHQSRNYDILARYDGALFAAVLPHAPLEDAIRYANKIQDEISGMSFSDPPTHAQLRFGIVACRNSTATCADRLLGEAMRGLLHAKGHKSNRIIARDLSTPLGDDN
jgi:two-component system cell cycle response regulator